MFASSYKKMKNKFKEYLKDKQNETINQEEFNERIHQEYQTPYQEAIAIKSKRKLNKSKGNRRGKIVVRQKSGQFKL